MMNSVYQQQICLLEKVRGRIIIILMVIIIIIYIILIFMYDTDTDRLTIVFFPFYFRFRRSFRSCKSIVNLCYPAVRWSSPSTLLFFWWFRLFFWWFKIFYYLVLVELYTRYYLIIYVSILQTSISGQRFAKRLKPDDHFSAFLANVLQCQSLRIRISTKAEFSLCKINKYKDVLK